MNLPAAGWQNKWILCRGPRSMWIRSVLCLSSFLGACAERGAVADGSFQETTGPKGIPQRRACSIQTTKAGCGLHTLVKAAKIVSAGCPTDCRQAEETAEQDWREAERNSLWFTLLIIFHRQNYMILWFFFHKGWDQNRIITKLWLQICYFDCLSGGGK